MEIVPLRVLGADLGLESAELFTANVDHALLDLQCAADEQEGRCRDQKGLPFEPLWCHDDVDGPRLVLERDKDEAFRRSRALATDHEAGPGDAFAVFSFRDELACGTNAVMRE